MEKVIISHACPPIYEVLKTKFNVDWDTGLIIAWDGKIHTKDSDNSLMPQKVIHECVHLKEQDRIGNEVWWKMYVDNEVFRFEQEVLAYRAEANFIKKNIKDREARFHMISEVASVFSSEMYGKIITKNEALQLLL